MYIEDPVPGIRVPGTATLAGTFGNIGALFGEVPARPPHDLGWWHLKILKYGFSIQVLLPRCDLVAFINTVLADSVTFLADSVTFLAGSKRNR